MLEPLGVDRTREHFEIYYFDEAVRGDGYADLRATNARQWRTVFEEDRGVVEGMQAGRASPAFTGGVFSPAMDTPTHCFHQWMAAALPSSSPSSVSSRSRTVGIARKHGTAAGRERGLY